MQKQFSQKHIALAVTGASGALYADRILAKLQRHGCRISIIFSQWAERVIRWEIPNSQLARYCVSPEESTDCLRIFSNDDLASPLASGSHGADATLVAPCSMGTLGRIAHGISGSLIERVADVMLKERRPLVLLARETPLSLIHLRNMCAVTEAGGIILPASPGFYHRPTTLEAAVDMVAERALAQVGLVDPSCVRWEGECEG